MASSGQDAAPSSQASAQAGPSQTPPPATAVTVPRHEGPADGAERGPRKIVVFSDGTGNSSAKLQRTNVWRLYEALDLGYPVPSGAPVQLAYYDDGVGTSSNKLVAALGGAFGFGLARNVRDIYKFLCRNWRPGDEIHAFGFSRGAYTIRLLVALVTSMGLVDYTGDEGELDLATRDNWREFRRAFRANNFIADFLVTLGRWLVTGFVRVRRRLLGQLPYGALVKARRRGLWPEYLEATRDRWFDVPAARRDNPPHEYGPEIAFVGVWDTVAAYGGPIVEITRAIDEWIWPLTMPNYRLSPKVKCARHALSIDDKRDAFTPLLWDEIAELKLPGYDAENPRLQQVWFAGMHSDVGGGYPDDSLAYVSLWWMIEHAEQGGQNGGGGIRLIPEFRERIATFRNIYGTIHDSRGGSGAFYRYQPRYIDAWVERQRGASQVLAASQVFRDPTIDHGRYRKHGQLEFPIRLHKSVEERLITATDGYAPNNLPSRYRVDDGIRGLSPAATAPLTPEGLDNLKACVDRMGDHIKLRRFWYFASACVFILLVLKPLWPALPVLSNLVGTVDARTDAHGLENAANAFVPSIARAWTAAIASDPWVSLVVIAGILATSALGAAEEGHMALIARRLWSQRLTPGAAVTPPPTPSLVERALLAVARVFHRSDRLAALLATLKWRLVPFFLGLAIWIANWLIAGVLFVQALLVPTEGRHTACPAPSVRASSPLVLDIASPCGDTGQRVTVAAVPSQYHVVIEDLGQDDARLGPPHWLDQTQPATPLGWSETDNASLARQWLTKPLLRLTTARLMQPVLELRRPMERVPGFDRVYMILPQLKATADHKWEGDFTVPQRVIGLRPGQRPNVYFFVNDAVLPIDQREKEWPVAQRLPDGTWICAPAEGAGLHVETLGGRYRNNCGRARVTITPAP